jgi:chaperonin GroES|tara:strand:- start:7905 stop:8255 length:351 start_codon:yes stop_codon:yes gene_type:complete
MAHHHVPQPIGWKVLVKPIEPKKESSGGILLPEMAREAEEYLIAHGHIISMGEMAYRDRDTGQTWKGKWPKVEDHVTFGKYAGQKLIVDGEKLLILNDDEITSIIPNGCSIETYVA